jgi:hypothetical protein
MTVYASLFNQSRVVTWQPVPTVWALGPLRQHAAAKAPCKFLSQALRVTLATIPAADDERNLRRSTTCSNPNQH